MNNNLENIRHCITIFHRCLISIENININENLHNIIAGYINNLNININNEDNNDIRVRLNIIFYQKIAYLNTALLLGNINNFVHEFNIFHNNLINFENDLIQNVN